MNADEKGVFRWSLLHLAGEGPSAQSVVCVHLRFLGSTRRLIGRRLLEEGGGQGVGPELRGSSHPGFAQMNAIVTVGRGERVVVRTGEAVRHLANHLFLRAANRRFVPRRRGAIHHHGEFRETEIGAGLLHPREVVREDLARVRLRPVVLPLIGEDGAHPGDRRVALQRGARLM